MAELTDSLATLSGWVFDLLNDETFKTDAGISMVMYGDQEKIPVTPMVCIEPSEKRRVLNGAPRRTQVDFEIFVLIYFGSIQASEFNRRGADELAEVVEAKLHKDPSCGTYVVDSQVSNLSSGVANKGGALLRATRLTFNARSQVQLPMKPGA